MCAASPVVHTSNVSSCQKKTLSQFSCGCEQFHSGRSFGFLVINVCNHREHYETPCIYLWCCSTTFPHSPCHTWGIYYFLGLAYICSLLMSVPVMYCHPSCHSYFCLAMIIKFVVPTWKRMIITWQAMNSLDTMTVRIGSYGILHFVGPTLFSDGPSCVGLQVKAVCSVTESEFVSWGWISYSELIINCPCCVFTEWGRCRLPLGANTWYIKCQITFTLRCTGWSKSVCAPAFCIVIIRCTETYWSPCIKLWFSSN